MILNYRNVPFALKRAELSATILDPYWVRTYEPNGEQRLFWSLEVVAERSGERLGPHLYHEHLDFPIRRWIEVAGQVVEWSQPYDPQSGELNGVFYVVQHGEIRRGCLRFLERDGVAFRFDWAGVCEVLWEDFGDEDKDDREAPFSASGWAEFTGVIVQGSERDTDETLRGRLATYLDPRDFAQGPLFMDGNRYESGVKMAHALFSPLGV